MSKKNTQKNIIVAAVIIVAIVVLLFLFKGSIYSMVVKYEDGGNRKNYELKDEGLATLINQNLPNDEALDANIDIDQIIDLSQEITSKTLDYFMEVRDADPHKTYKEGFADYIGFAAFTATTGNYLIKRFGMDKEWEAKPKKGKLFLFGDNKSKKAEDGWFKDHDFVIFRNKKTKEEIYVDPSAYESYGVKRVDKRQK